MKKKAIVFCLLGVMALGTCTVSAANGTRNISATFRNIKIVVDGKEVSTSAEPFIYNGTTYLPIRAVGEAVGKEVTWNAGTNTVYLGEVPASAQQQPEAPVTPEAPASVVASSLPILVKHVEENKSMSKDEFASIYEEIRSGNESAYIIAETYYVLIDLYSKDSEEVKSTYAEAQVAFAGITNNPDYAEAKAWFEVMWQNNFQPYL